MERIRRDPADQHSGKSADELIPAKQVCKRYKITDRTLARWLDRPELGFPKPALIVLTRRYWSLADLVAFERGQVARAAR